MTGDALGKRMKRFYEEIPKTRLLRKSISWQKILLSISLLAG